MNTLVNPKNWQELIRPDKLAVAAGADPKRLATVVAEPLERGFGVTLGNALRRILLSSLQGAGGDLGADRRRAARVLLDRGACARDVTDIVLNIKDIAIKMQGEGPKKMVLKKQGPGQVLAGDIQTVGDVQILNPDLVLCTLDDGAEIRMEFTVATGKGYVASDRNRSEDSPIGLVPVDSLYSPSARGQLSRRKYPRRPDPRLRQAHDDDRNRRLNHARRFAGLRSAYSAGPAQHLRQFRRAAPRDRSTGDAGAAVQPGAAQEGWTSWNFPFARPTVSRTTTSFTSAT